MSKEGLERVNGETVSGGVLLGRHDYALDPKRRVTIPSEWRSMMGSVIYVLPDRKERCLNLYSKAEMDVLLNQLREKALFDAKYNRVFAKLGAVSQQLSLDVQGRIRICDKLLAYAELDDTIAMIGSVRMIKLYNPKAIGPADEVDIGELDAVLKEVGM